MITCCNFEDIKQEIAKHIRDHRLIPVIGSGFSAHSPSHNGVVPTGSEMKNYMIEVISQLQSLTRTILEDKSFSQISTYYHKLESEVSQKSYVRDHFSHVQLPPEKIRLLEIDWLYIYTLNMDDAIENCSQYKKVICSNREVDFSIVNDNKCTIKLHGDVSSYLTYYDDESKIFDFKQYARSISTNQSLLNKLRHDFKYNNLIFIGCSLDNEFDLATMDMDEYRTVDQLTSKYYFTVDEPDDLKKIELEEYGITHIVLNKDFSQIYSNVYDAYILSQQIQVNDIDIYLNLAIKQLPNAFEFSSPYLLYGKSIIDIKNREAILPAYFIDRTIGNKILENLKHNTIHIIYGPRVSGKTYLLASIHRRVRDRDVYFFDSRNNINSAALNSILNKDDTLIIFDTNSINKDRIYDLIHQQTKIEAKRNNVIIAINTSDKDIVSIINNNILDVKILGYQLDPRFHQVELSNINKLMALNGLPNFDGRKTILDNILKMEKAFVSNGKFSRIQPYTRNVDDLIVLILLAVNDKLYTQDLVRFNIDRECFEQIQKTTPLITEEHTLLFERDLYNSSGKKFVVNAKYWLFESLGSFAEIKNNHSMIVEAYQRIVSVVLKLAKKYSYSAAMDYFKFDVINEVFQTDTKGQLGLAKSIYEGLHSLLSFNPHYYHQCAKCYLWQSKNDISSLKDLEDALRFANIAKYNLEIVAEQFPSENIDISLAHIRFTIALITSRISAILGHTIDARKNAISAIYDAIQSRYNMSDFRDIKKKRQNKRDDISDVIQYSSNKTTGIDKELNKELSYIIGQIMHIS